MPSLRELQQRFAQALRGDAAVSPGLLVYRNTARTNYRSALAATYPVVRALVGAPFFDTAADAYVEARPSTSGDLNVYGGDFGDFLETDPYAAHLPYLRDVARLEWALDEAARAADVDAAPEAVIATLAKITAGHALLLHPSVRIIASRYPVWRIWHVHQPQYAGDPRVALDDAIEHVLVHREPRAVAVERVPVGEAVFLQASCEGDTLGRAVARAIEADARFDLGDVLKRRVGDATIIGARA